MAVPSAKDYAFQRSISDYRKSAQLLLKSFAEVEIDDDAKRVAIDAVSNNCYDALAMCDVAEKYLYEKKYDLLRECCIGIERALIYASGNDPDAEGEE